MQARKTHQRQMAGVSVGMCLYPSHGVRDEIKRAGGQPKDHAKENIKLIKQLQKNNKMKQEELSKPKPPVFKLKQFEAVLPKLDTNRRPTSSTCTLSERDENSRPDSAFSNASTMNSQKKKNFIKENALKAKTSSPKIPSTPEPTGARKTRIGSVPKYLVDRKMEWAQQEEARLQALEQQKIPPGMMFIPDQERLATLDKLVKNREILVQQHSRLPVVIETESLKMKKLDLETKLSEIEDSIALFSKSKLLVSKQDYEML